MDRRQKKTRAAIFHAFSSLLARKSYSKITVQEIIDQADIGRTTFYAHFETKDDLLRALCEELFGHIIGSAKDCTHTHGLSTDGSAPESVFCHLLQHLQENDYNILGLLSSESSGIFLRYFKDSLNELIWLQFTDHFHANGEDAYLFHCQTERTKNPGDHSRKISPEDKAKIILPEDFVVNHISGSFVEMVLWWIKGGMKQAPEELDRYFREVLEPVL